MAHPEERISKITSYVLIVLLIALFILVKDVPFLSLFSRSSRETKAESSPKPVDPTLEDSRFEIATVSNRVKRIHAHKIAKAKAKVDHIHHGADVDSGGADADGSVPDKEESFRPHKLARGPRAKRRRVEFGEDNSPGGSTSTLGADADGSVPDKEESFRPDKLGTKGMRAKRRRIES
eukprot:RCo009876